MNVTANELDQMVNNLDKLLEAKKARIRRDQLFKDYHDAQKEYKRLKDEALKGNGDVA